MGTNLGRKAKCLEVAQPDTTKVTLLTLLQIQGGILFRSCAVDYRATAMSQANPLPVVILSTKFSCRTEDRT